MGTFDDELKSQMSRVTKRSQNKTLTTGELKDYFNKGKEDIQSRHSRVSINTKASGLSKVRRLRKEVLEAAIPAQPDAKPVEPETMTVDDVATLVSSGAQDEQSQVPTEAEGDDISVVPSQAATEFLAEEYKKLLSEYDQMRETNKEMEDQVEKLKATFNPE